MQFPDLPKRDWWAALAVGIANAVLLSAVMVPVMRAGLSPLPKPVGLAFAETVLGTGLPMPVGLLFHLVYVAAWTMIFVAVFRRALTFKNALVLGLALWILALVVFFPIIGWGVLGLGEGRQLIVASLVPHLLFAVFLWGLCRLAFKNAAPDQSRRGS